MKIGASIACVIVALFAWFFAIILFFLCRANGKVLLSINVNGVFKKSLKNLFIPWNAIDKVQVKENPFAKMTPSGLDTIYLTVSDKKFLNPTLRFFIALIKWITIIAAIIVPIIVVFAILAHKPAALSSLAGLAALSTVYGFLRSYLKNKGSNDVAIDIYTFEPTQQTLHIAPTDFLKINTKLDIVTIRKLLADKSKPASSFQ
jgi:small basic protein